jgi:flavodoxin
LDAVVKRPVFGGLTVTELGTYDLLIVGSPTQEGKQLTSIKILLDSVSDGALKDKKVAAFDTRHKWKFLKFFNYAAPRIAETLQARGGILIAPAEGQIFSGYSCLKLLSFSPANNWSLLCP